MDGCKIITLCGSTRFKDEFIKTQERLTLEGNIVISVALFSHADNIKIKPDVKAMLDEIHKKKIEISDEIFVIDVDKYIGESTRSEIEYATKLGLPIHYYSDWTLQKNLEKLDTYESYRAQYPDSIRPMRIGVREQVKKALPLFSRQPILSFIPEGAVQFRWEIKRYEKTTKTDVLAFTFNGSNFIEVLLERYGTNNRVRNPIYRQEEVIHIDSLPDLPPMVKEFYELSTEEVLEKYKKAEDKQ